MTTARCEICLRPITIEDGMLPRCPFCGYDPTDQDPALDGEFMMGDLLASPAPALHARRLLYVAQVDDVRQDDGTERLEYRVQWPHLAELPEFWIDADAIHAVGWRLASTTEIRNEVARVTRERNRR